MPKESTHALKHWVEIQASAAIEHALKDRPGQLYHSDLLNENYEFDLQEIADDFRAAVNDKRYYEIARTKAIRLAANLLRVAAIAHKEGTRE
jgi:nuclear transport factor 2 (NTF2) superfamily protein